MNILNSYKIVSTTFCLLAGAAAFAQGGTSTTDVPVSGGATQGVNKDWLPSRTNDGAYDRVSHYVTPIQWQKIREDDILWRKRVWREIDTREKQNVAFRYAGDEASGGGMFIEILLDAIKKGKVAAYKNDDRFTTLMTKEDITDITAGKVDSIPVMDPITGVETIREIHRDFNPESITKYRIKEDWIFDRNQGQMVVRIVGLSPVQDVIGDDGQYRGSKSMFWLYYPSIREMLSQYEVYNPQNDMMRYTWDEFFESRQFASKITKVSNAFGNSFGDHLNPMESLYESRRTSEEIFNKEVDMWVY